jgi:hypothetical protein
VIIKAKNRTVIWNGGVCMAQCFLINQILVRRAIPVSIQIVLQKT